ncbi:Coiled-coil domain-containing protein 124-like protein [Lasiodiplodia hormozganensis]|uniref:Coiled-coil domain-containing protein 124-like protein n=1 Tax=Lasiodiplodia hormozganensis TaxID=869390 RepID=A0AA39YF85_9PEZI|nr:Coiled-coil domain-containing protein 124-like protein [Lasiodiplodia hormozganensis]
MAKGGKGAGENSKKAAGNARKAEAAAKKQEASNKVKAAAEDAEWAKGSKNNSKAEAAAAKKAEADRKKAEKDALMREEEASLPSKGPSKTKTAQKKTRSGGLDDALGAFDAPAKKGATLNASGIDNALDALSLGTGKGDDKVDRHPERRFKAAYAAYEERRLEELKDDKSLRRNQKIEMIYKEFKTHPDNPFNQVSAKFNSTREEISDIKAAEKSKVENRLAEKS